MYSLQLRKKKMELCKLIRNVIRERKQNLNYYCNEMTVFFQIALKTSVNHNCH